MPENKSIQVMRFVTQGAHLDTITSFEQLAGYSLLEVECHVARFIPFGGQPILLMFGLREDKVRMEEMDYRKLKYLYDGTNPQVRKLIEDADKYLEGIRQQQAKVSEDYFSEIHKLTK